MVDDAKPYLWLLDSERKPLADYLDLFADWADVVYIGPGQVVPDWDEQPDAVFFSAEIAGGVHGSLFAELSGEAGNVPLLAIAKLRSLSQAVSFFRAGATDYLSLPLDGDELQERLNAALEKAARMAINGMMVQFESVAPDAGEISVSLRTATAVEDDDILAHLPESADSVNNAEPTESVMSEIPETVPAAAPRQAEPPPMPVCVEPETEDASPAAEEEPETVDGLPIPTLWEELPCGLLVFDSDGNLVFSNSLGLDLFGFSSLAELEDALECRREEFKAYGANHKPLPDNQWPQVLALKSRVARAAVLSVEKRDKHRLWLRIDCLPHLSDGKINRLTMTIVNMTGELPPLVLTTPSAAPPLSVKRPKAKARGRRRK